MAENKQKILPKSAPLVKSFRANGESPKTQKVSIIALILLIVIVVAFLGTPAVSLGAGSDLSTLEFGRYGSRSVRFTENSYFALRILNDTNNFPGALDGFFARLIFQNAFRDAMVHEAWLDEAARFGIAISNDAIMTSLREQGLTNAMLVNMTLLQRTQLFDLERDALTTERIQSNLLEGLNRPANFLEFIINPTQIERNFMLAYFSYDQISTDFLAQYIDDQPRLFQRWPLRRHIFIGSAGDAQELEQRIVRGEISIAELALEQAESVMFFTDVFASSAGLMGPTMLYQILEDIDMSEEEFYMLLTGLGSDGGRLPVMPFLNALGGSQEAYVFYQLEAEMVAPNLALAADRESVFNHLQRYSSELLLDYHFVRQQELQGVSDAEFATRAVALGAVPLESNYFSMVHGLDITNAYSPYTGLLMQFRTAIPGLTPAVVENILGSELFFREAFGRELGYTSEMILLDSGILVLRPMSEQASVMPNREIDKAFMEQFLLMQARNSVERAFPSSRRYRDRFDTAFQRYARLAGLE